jgi:hypothetical protein
MIRVTGLCGSDPLYVGLPARLSGRRRLRKTVLSRPPIPPQTGTSPDWRDKAPGLPRWIASRPGPLIPSPHLAAVKSDSTAHSASGSTRLSPYTNPARLHRHGLCRHFRPARSRRLTTRVKGYGVTQPPRPRGQDKRDTVTRTIVTGRRPHLGRLDDRNGRSRGCRGTAAPPGARREYTSMATMTAKAAAITAGIPASRTP